MKQRPPDSDDPTAEEEPPEFDGTATAPLGDAYRVRVVTASESANEPAGSTTRANAKSATDQFEAVQKTLKLAAREPKPLTESGHDPEATGVFLLPKIGS
jgi:hypothetical protein